MENTPKVHTALESSPVERNNLNRKSPPLSLHR
jgi:hypothetical protein